MLLVENLCRLEKADMRASTDASMHTAACTASGAMVLPKTDCQCNSLTPAAEYTGYASKLLTQALAARSNTNGLTGPVAAADCSLACE